MGVNFLKISEGMASLNYREYLQRYLLVTVLLSTCLMQQMSTAMFFILFQVQCNDQLMKNFLYNFQQKRSIYVKAIKSLSVSALSCNHTFKIICNVGLVRKTNKAFVMQFSKSFISLNELGEVVAWTLTKSTTFSEIEDLLVDLQKRNSLMGNTVDLVCVDDCCRVHNKYINIFPNAALYNQVTKEFVQVLRDDDDQGKMCHKNTPAKEKIERNLNSFVNRWSNIPDNPLANATFVEIIKLREHIKKGCLSDIPPGLSETKASAEF